ncbi:MAG TPA: hypothetical protein HPQ03_09385 [Deltaproteobacteria bacterium]|nr:hypothetical protein [Deltaproteobacteria bacterium]
MRYLTVITLILVLVAAAMADELDTAACVQKLDFFRGVIVSKIVADHHYKGRKWCYVFTENNTVNAWLDELQAISCADAVENFTKRRKQKLFQWMGGGPNPMFTDTVDRSE